MNDTTLADRLVSYGDALAALAFVGTSGLSLALADPDVRCSLTQGIVPVVVGNTLFSSAITLVVVVLRRWEQRLRQGSHVSVEATRISRYIFTARLVVVWLAAAGAVGVLVAATRDPRCSLAA